ncbi:MAG TPA: TetR/AcrR family transcriptional regulator [Verrucomicrobiae bacterium]|jgi:AcrR family transcriptional regulator
MVKTPKQDCKARILDAAERSFANAGFEGASLRHIVLDAKVNLPTVYYYFESKAGLMSAVMNRRFGPVRQESVELLKQFEREAKGRPVAVEKILEAMIAPPLRLATEKSANSSVIMRLLGRIVTDPHVKTQKLMRCQHDEVRTIFLGALHRSLPNLSMCDLRWRVEFLWGALAFILVNPRKIESEAEGACDPLDTKIVLAAMINFFSAGFRAPAMSKSKCKT